MQVYDTVNFDQNPLAYENELNCTELEINWSNIFTNLIIKDIMSLSFLKIK